MGVSGSVPEERKDELGASAISAFHRAVEMFEVDPEGVLVMMKCILSEMESQGLDLAQYIAAENSSLEGDWKFILERVSRHKQAAPLFKEAYNLFKLSDEESRMNSGEDGVKQRRQLHMFLDEALSYNMLTRHDIDRIEEEIAAGARTAGYFLGVWRGKIARERTRQENLARTAKVEHEHNRRIELAAQDAQERTKRDAVVRKTKKNTKPMISEDPNAKPLLWVRDDAIARSTYVSDYMHAPTFHQQFIERALTNAPNSDGVGSNISSYGGEAGLIKRAVQQADQAKHEKEGRVVKRAVRERRVEVGFGHRNRGLVPEASGPEQEDELRGTLRKQMEASSAREAATLGRQDRELPLHDRNFWSEWRHRWRNADGDAAIKDIKKRIKRIKAAAKSASQASTNDEEVVEAESAENVENELCQTDSAGWTALHHASFGVPASVVSALTSACPAAASMKDKDGLVPLHYAVRYGAPGAVEKILRHAPSSARIQCSAQNINGWLPLHLAVRYGASPAVIAALLKANRSAAKAWATDAASKATGLAKVVSDNGQLALHMCAREAAWMAAANSFADWHRPWPSSEAVCRLLIKAYPQAAAVPDRYGRLPIHYIAKACCPEPPVSEDHDSENVGDVGYDIAVGSGDAGADTSKLSISSPRTGRNPSTSPRKTARSPQAVGDDGVVPVEEGAPLSMVISLLAANPPAVYVPDKDGELPLHKRIILCALDRFYDTLTNFSSRQEQFRRAIEEQVAHGLITRDEGDVMIHENESLKVGDRVLLSLSVVEQEDWERGPMRIGDFGVIIEHDPTDTMLPFKVMKTGYNLSYWYARDSLVRNSGYDWQCLRAIIDGYPEGFVAVAGERVRPTITVMSSMLDEDQRFDTYALIQPEREPTKLESEFNLRGKLRAAAYTQGGLDFEALFSQFDADGSGELDLEEFSMAMRKAAKISIAEVSDVELEEMFNLVDADHSGDVDVDEFCTWLGDGDGEYDSSKVSSVPNVELVAAADGGYTVKDIKRVLRLCLENRNVRIFLSNARRYASLKSAASKRLQQIEVNLDELFFAEELAESVGSLEKNPVIIDEDAPLKDKITRIPDSVLDSELAKRGVATKKGSRGFREQQLLKLLRAEEEEEAQRKELLAGFDDAVGAQTVDSSDSDPDGDEEDDEKMEDFPQVDSPANEEEPVAEDPRTKLVKMNDACVAIFQEHAHGGEMASIAHLRALLTAFQAEEFKYNTGEEDVDPNNFRVSDRDYEMLRKKAMEMEGLHSDGIHVSFTTMKKLVGLPLLEDEVQDLIARISDDLNEIKEEIQDEDPGPMLNKKLQKAAKYTASLQYHVKLLEELQDDGSQRTLRHDDVLPLELVMEFEEDYIADGDADLPETDAIAEPVRRRSSSKRKESFRMSSQELEVILRESQAKEEDGTAKDTEGGDGDEDTEEGEGARLVEREQQASSGALQLVEQNELVVAHLLHMMASSLRKRFTLIMKDVLVGDEDPVSLLHVPPAKPVPRTEKRLIENSQEELDQLPTYLAEIDDAINLRSFPKLASSIWWPVVSKFSDWKDERPPIDNITDLQAMSVVDFKEVGFREFEAVQLSQTIQRRKRKEKKELRPRSCGNCNLDVLRCSMTYRTPQALMEGFNRLSAKYDNAENRFRFYVDNGYTLNGDWTETATSKFRAVTVHFVWKPYDDEIYTFADFFEQFGRTCQRYVQDCPQRHQALAQEALNRIEAYSEALRSYSDEEGSTAAESANQRTDSESDRIDEPVEMVVEVRLIYQPFFELGIREAGICYSILNAKTIRDVTRYVAEKPTELQKFEAAALIQAHVRRFTTMLRMKRQRDAEEAARKEKNIKLRRFDELMEQLETSTKAEDWDTAEAAGKEMDEILKVLHPKLTSKDIAASQAAYKQVDLDGNGGLDIEEIAEMFKVLGVQLDETALKNLFNKFDRDGSGELDFHEFLDLRESMMQDDDTMPKKRKKGKGRRR